MLLIGHVIDELRKLPAQSVHCCATSPPYWGLRAYGTVPQVWGGDSECGHEFGDDVRSPWANAVSGPGSTGKNNDYWKQFGKTSGNYCLKCSAWRGELGSEPTIEQYVSNIVAVFAEVHRVLRDDGTLWMNLGDSFSDGGRNSHGTRIGFKQGTNRASSNGHDENRKSDPGLKPKDLCGIPWRVALALQAWGWYLRMDIIWAKRSPMPESVTDRPTKAHEYVFLLSKRERYFYDYVAVKEATTGNAHPRGHGVNPKCHSGIQGREKQNESFSGAVAAIVDRRNLRSVWSLSNQSYKGAHFATFPPKLVIPCITAGTSEHGVCAECGAPWRRMVERKRVATRPGEATKVKTPGRSSRIFVDRDPQHSSDRKERDDVLDSSIVGNRDPKRHISVTETTGWAPTCKCGTDERFPATVLDPFMGSGTTAAVAEYLGRAWVGCELNEQYAELARDRIAAGYQPTKERKKRRRFLKSQQSLFSGD